MKQTVYIASPESQQIHVWNLNHEGALTLIQHSPPKATNFSCYSQLLNAKEHS